MSVLDTRLKPQLRSGLPNLNNYLYMYLSDLKHRTFYSQKKELKIYKKTLNVSIDTTRKPFVYMYEGKPVGFEIEVLYMF